ncbi:uncharacterized protein MKZ38_002511 [Zalerion maritima]|uniref:RNA helicase n=1 Tax=Zalerion maritima TaxID=339359 RepID=A0AAD5RVL3_9PEZI|nr:uncharacterized protein MKZ38_002511 [Zalerion maritima]
MATKRQSGTDSAVDRPYKRQKKQDPYIVGRKELPIWRYKDQIKEAMLKKDVLIVVGATGSGKSTQVPQFLFREDWCQRRIIKAPRHTGKDGSNKNDGVIRYDEDRNDAEDNRMEDAGVGGLIAITQPRRVAATTLAHRVSREAGTPLNEGTKGLVGYSVRFDHKIPRGTKIKFLTEGMLLQELIHDPNLRQYSAIIVDEIHERSVDVDLLSGFLKQILQGDNAGRGGIPLKVIIMSATADVEEIQQFFAHTTTGSNDNSNSKASNIEVLQVEGRQHPVTVIHSPNPVPRLDVQDAITKRVFQINQTEPLPGDILAFMTGQEEIESTQKLIEEYAKSLPKGVPSVRVFPLYGQLSMDSQAEAFKPVKEPRTRKVVLATNIAETSVTVPGVRYVIDCGDAKVKLFLPNQQIECLRAIPISKSSVTQRTGRAGREAPGKCYRLYTKGDYSKFMDADLPEILRVDIAGAILAMKARGIKDIHSFPLMDPPEPERVEKALVQLHFMGALSNATGEITDIGKKMALFPVTAPYGRVLIAAADPSSNCLLEAIDIISCITAGESIFYQLRSEEEAEEVEELRMQLYRREGDLLTYLMAMQAYTSENTNRVVWCKDRRINIRNIRQALKIRKQLRFLCKDRGLIDEIPRDPQPFIPMSPERADILLKCFLRGFALKTAFLAPDKSYITSQGRHQVAIHPSSVLRGRKKEAIMYLEHVVTQKSYAKKVSAVQAQWVLDALNGK